MGEGGGFGWGGVEGWGEKAYNCNWITIKIKKRNLYSYISDTLKQKLRLILFQDRYILLRFVVYKVEEELHGSSTFISNMFLFENISLSTVKVKICL